MHINLQDALIILTIISVIGGWLHSQVIAPIKKVLYSIEKQIEKIEMRIEKSTDERKMFFEKLGRLDESTASAHHRINGLEEDIKELRARL